MNILSVQLGFPSFISQTFLLYLIFFGWFFSFTWINNLFRLSSQHFLISFSGQIEQTCSIFPHLATIMVLNYRIVICWFFSFYFGSLLFSYFLLVLLLFVLFLVSWFFTAIDCMQLSIWASILFWLNYSLNYWFHH